MLFYDRLKWNAARLFPLVFSICCNKFVCTSEKQMINLSFPSHGCDWCAALVALYRLASIANRVKKNHMRSLQENQCQSSPMMYVWYNITESVILDRINVKTNETRVKTFKCCSFLPLYYCQCRMQMNEDIFNVQTSVVIVVAYPAGCRQEKCCPQFQFFCRQIVRFR